jgi:FKBP-type peptidyl-prolyl cis-trans isomerase FkpA
MKQNSWKALIGLVLASSTVLSLSACENKNAQTNPANTASTANAASPSGAEMLSGVRNVSGIRIEDVKEGDGRQAKKGDSVSVNYLGTLASNGKKFDSSYDRNEPITFKLGSGQVIEGWEKGIEGMKVGGKRVLTIPPDKAYGPDGYPPVIPPNATLKFEVELVDVN